MIYRRYKHGDVVEGIEIGWRERPRGPFVREDRRLKRAIRVAFLKEEAEALLYDVELPPSMNVVPPDLRRWAYDHDAVARLVSRCVIDNAAAYLFSPLNDDTIARLKASLLLALQDLSAVADNITVALRPSPGGSGSELNVCVAFEHKNGEAGQVVVPYPPSDSVNR